MNTHLQKAAQAMIDRWDSPDWKDTPHTAHYVAELRKALDAELAQSVEPEVLMVDAAMVEMKNIVPPLRRSECLRLIRAAINATAHPPQPQATYSDSTPLLHVGNSSFEGWFQERDRAGKSDKQLAREAYAAGMGDPLVTYAAAQGEKPQATTPVPDGYVLVPVEPTDEELAKGVRAMSLFVTKNSLIDFSLGYKAMLTAAQGEKP